MFNDHEAKKKILSLAYGEHRSSYAAKAANEWSKIENPKWNETADENPGSRNKESLKLDSLHLKWSHALTWVDKHSTFLLVKNVKEDETRCATSSNANEKTIEFAFFFYQFIRLFLPKKFYGYRMKMAKRRQLRLKFTYYYYFITYTPSLTVSRHLDIFHIFLLFWWSLNHHRLSIVAFTLSLHLFLLSDDFRFIVCECHDVKISRW